MYKFIGIGGPSTSPISMGVLDRINDGLQYKKLTDEQKINYIKYKYNLTHGKGKRKKKKGGKK